MMQAGRRCVWTTASVVVLACLAWPFSPLRARAAGDGAPVLLRLMEAQGVAGSESGVIDAISGQLPSWARPRVDELGNLVVTMGQGKPHVLVTTSVDEDGFVVSRITDEGYLRLQRVSGGIEHRLFDQYHYSRPVMIRTERGTLVPGVTASTSLHLGGAQVMARGIKTLDDVWVDVGASSRADVERLGIQVLDAVAARPRVQELTGGRVAGMAAQARANAAAMVGALAGLERAPAVTGTVTFAWTTQGTFRGKGLARLARTIDPDRVIVLGRAQLGREPDPRGALGVLGGGPVVPASNAGAAEQAARIGVPLQQVPALSSPTPWPAARVDVVALPVLFAQTPVETVDPRDVASMTSLVAAIAGIGGARATLAASPSAVLPRPPAAPGVAPEPPIFRDLRVLIETYGVSPNEAPVRDRIRALLPAWATPEVDAKGNLTVSFGTGGKQLLFMSHMDEVGYQITNVRDDGTATVRRQGGLSDAMFESRLAMAQSAKGLVPAIVAPRPNYGRTTEPVPAADDVFVYFGTTSRQETEALGVAKGDTVTVRKTFERLAGTRGTGRSMDDRSGVASLLAVLKKLDPAKVRNRVTFAWTVGEETGLTGATALAERLHPDYAIAVDTTPSSDSPVDQPRLAYVPLGSGAVIRGMDTSTIVRRAEVTQLLSLARARGVPVTVTTTSGGTDASTFTPVGSAVFMLSWPGRYSHSSVEVVDARDLDALAALILAVIEGF